jgi:hypothetical protein
MIFGERKMLLEICEGWEIDLYFVMNRYHRTKVTELTIIHEVSSLLMANTTIDSTD